MNRWSIFNLCLICLLAISGCKKDEGLSEEQKATYLKKYGVAATGADMAKTDDGGFILLGTTSRGATKDIIIVKTDDYGNQEWYKIIDGGLGTDDQASAITLTPSGGFAIVGTTLEIIDSLGITIQTNKSLLIITDASGNVQNSLTFGVNGQEFQRDTLVDPGDSTEWNVFGNGIAVDAAGNYILACDAKDKFTADQVGVGRLISSTDLSQLGVVFCFIEDPTNGGIFNVNFKDVVQAGDGSMIFVGSTEFAGSLGLGGGMNVWLTDYDQIDNTNTSGVGNYFILGGPEDDEAFSLTLNAAGNIVVTGYQTNTNGNKDIYIAENQVPASNGVIWENSFGENDASEDNGRGIFSLSDGYLIAGSTRNTAEEPQLYLAKTDASGNRLWSKSYGFIEFDEANAVCETSDGGYALFGTVTDERGNANMCLLKTDSKGELK